jgi:hypothetical protein
VFASPHFRVAAAAKVTRLRAARMVAPAAAMEAFTAEERASLAERDDAASADRAYFGGIRMPPSTRTTSPFM